VLVNVNDMYTCITLRDVEVSPTVDARAFLDAVGIAADGRL
jgi:hypothetical protein